MPDAGLTASRRGAAATTRRWSTGRPARVAESGCGSTVDAGACEAMLKKWRDEMHLAASDLCSLSGAVIAVDAETR